MKGVSLTKVKSSLCRMLELVKAGEELLIKDRGSPIAIIEPIAPNDDQWPDLLVRDGVLLAPKHELTNAKLTKLMED